MAATCATAAATVISGIALNGTAASPTPRRLGSDLRPFRVLGVDIIGKDTKKEELRDAEFCFYKAWYYSDTNEKGYSAVSSKGTMCYYKETDFKTTASIPNAGVDSLFLLENSNANIIWSATRDGVDMVGYDLTNTKRGKMSGCMTDCVANQKCHAVTWTNYQGGTCWLKSRASAYVPKPGAQSAYVAREYYDFLY